MNPRRVISFHYTLTDPEGNLIDSTQGEKPFTYMEGAGQMIPGLEAALQNFKKGDKKKVKVPSAQAYGPRDEQLVMQIPREKFPNKEINIGDQFQTSNDPNSPPLTVADFNENMVVLDANHPLAGMDLSFEVEIVDIREATAEELSHGHAHGPEGHGH
jgi:FKBP-type peptidyl-prolyl cis-trans isomerase SlyD